MTLGAASKSLSENGRPANEPGAKVMGIDRLGENSPRPEHRVNSMAFAEGKNTGSHPGAGRGTVLSPTRGSLPGKNPQKTSSAVQLPALGRNDLIRETQSIVLRFPTKQVAEEQDSTIKAVESQRNGESSISLLAAVNMARANPRARAEFARLFGCTGRMTDPDFMEGVEKIAEFYWREQQRAEDGPAEACDAAMGDLFGQVI